VVQANYFNFNLCSVHAVCTCSVGAEIYFRMCPILGQDKNDVRSFVVEIGPTSYTIYMVIWTLHFEEIYKFQQFFYRSQYLFTIKSIRKRDKK
jgi:hypothetical protein